MTHHHAILRTRQLSGLLRIIVDNVEQVKIASPTAGDVYTITVTHKGTLAFAPQAFSLIVTGIQPEPTVTPTPTPSSYLLWTK